MALENPAASLTRRESGHLLRILAVLGVSVLVLDAVYGVFALASGSRVLAVPALLDLCSLPLWILAFGTLLLRRKSLDREEWLGGLGEEEVRELKRSKLFGQSYEDVILSQQADFLEKRLAPFLVSLALFLAVALAAGLVLLPFGADFSRHGVVLHGAFLLLRAALAFVAARYLVGLAEPLAQGRVLALGGWQLQQASLSLLLAASAAAGLAGPGGPGRFAAAGLLLAFVLEALLRALWRLYAEKPSPVPPYCTLLVRLRLRGSVARGVEEAAAYQFGFDLRQDLRRTLLRAAAPLVLLFLAALLLGTSFGVVPVGSVGYMERFGRLDRRGMEPGLYVKLPWPCTCLHLVDTGLVRSVEVGTKLRAQAGRILWKEEEQEAGRLLLVGDDSPGGRDHPFEIFAVNAVLQYRVGDPERWLYSHADPERLVRQEAERHLALGALSARAGILFSGDRAWLERKIASGLQARLDALQAGVRVIAFSIPQVHPPKNAVEAFEAAVGARYRKEQVVLEAQAQALALSARLQDEARSVIAQSSSASAAFLSAARAERVYYEKTVEVHRLPGSVFLERQGLERLAASLAGARKIMLLCRPEREVVILDLVEALNPDILDLTLQAKDKK